MSSSKSDNEPDFGDPYELLGLTASSTSATEAQINTAFRKASLKLHPDKQSGKSESEKIVIAKRFHNLKEARAFLLDSTLRIPYDTKRASKRRRQAQDVAREQSMTERRRKMKKDLVNKEAMLKRKSNHNEQPNDQAKVNKLRKDGKRRRQEFADKAAEKELFEKSQRVMATKKSKSEKKARQIRLKWSRKRISVSPSEHSIAELFSKQFGKVTEVELIGSKGNSALITFQSASSCQPCVDFYAQSDEMRATFVVEPEEEEEKVADEQQEEPMASSKNQGESLEDRNLRQAAERERLMQEMEQEESGVATMPTKKKNTGAPSSSLQSDPLPFPQTDDINTLATPFEKLQYLERQLFPEIFPKGGEFLDQILTELQV